MKKKLTICDGDYGLPTFNVECFQLLIYAKMTKHQLYVPETPWRLPLLILDTGYGIIHLLFFYNLNSLRALFSN